MKTLNNYNEGDKVWFVDADHSGEYAEYGKIVAFKKNGDMVIESYFGMFVADKETIFPTEEECEKYIYISKIAKEIKSE